MFIDFEDILFDTDTFVCKQIYKALCAMKPEDCAKHPLHYLKDAIDQAGENTINTITKLKNTSNPLEEFIDEELLEEGIQPDILANTFYYTILDDDSDENMLVGEVLPTTFAESINAVLQDTNFKMAYVYVNGELTDAKHVLISSFFNYNPKITMVTGDKLAFIKQYQIDTYAFKNISEIEYLKMIPNRSVDTALEFITTEAPFNHNLWEQTKDEDGFHEDLSKTFNISVSFFNRT